MSGSISSRNDLFSSCWSPYVPPPKPLLRHLPSISTEGLLSKYGEETDGVGESSQSPSTSWCTATLPLPRERTSPRTTSFFDTTFPPKISPPRPLPVKHDIQQRPIVVTPFAPAPSTQARPNNSSGKPFPVLNLDDSWSGLSASPISLQAIDCLSPLHQSPSLPSSISWLPPLPASSQNVNLRFLPSASHVLGEGRYAKVFLASYQRTGDLCEGKGKRDLDNTSKDPQSFRKLMDPIINDSGDGIAGGSWRLCAAKLMASDRESQTLGLREAFFLNRLRGQSDGLRPIHGASEGQRARAVLSSRDARLTGSLDATSSRTTNEHHPGCVYIVKLIAVKEDRTSPASRIGSRHGRSSSDARNPGLRPELERRMSILSLPSLKHAEQADSLARYPSPSRLILLLEHAPLGTLDRLLRTSPELVGRRMWERWARQGAEALSWIHSKAVVHADVKPGNLLLTANLHIRLSDFGSSLLIHPSHPPTDGLGLGTLPFSSPELVDPSRSFSFPVDIFAFGATLYQCITGHEPFRTVRAVEMMHHVRKGALWKFEERARIDRIGRDNDDSVRGSPYPSAWRSPGDGVRRGGSLRVPAVSMTHEFHRPGLTRTSSAESLRASEDLAEGRVESPLANRLWAKWVHDQSGSAPGHGTIAALLADGDDWPPSPAPTVPRRASIRSTFSPSHPPIVEQPADESETHRTELPSGSSDAPYMDGSPASTFLDGHDRVPENVRGAIKAMVDSDACRRPTSQELIDWWNTLGVGARSPDGGWL